jgi:hypothetical protein
MADQILALVGVALVPVSCVLTALWITARRRAQRAEAMMQQVAIALAARGDRHGSELGQAVDAIALEVERIAEGQRFVARLLEEGAARDVVPATRPRRGTPH